MFRYLRNEEIERERWDQLVALAPNSRVYAMSWYLDRVSENWDALVWGDYQYVMPINSRRKWGITYLYTPVFCQQLGIFPVPPEEIQQKFMDSLRGRFRYIQIQVNSNLHPQAFEGFKISTRDNYVLPLFESYSAISANYSRHTARNLAKAKKAGVTVVRGLSAREFINFKKGNADARADDKTYHSLEKIISYTQSAGNGFIISAYTFHNELCASAFFLRSGHRVVYLSAFSTDEGKATSSMYAIVDSFIRESAGSGLLLDFEGSTIPGIARFYKGFAAHLETYYHLYHNNLIFPLNRIK